MRVAELRLRAAAAPIALWLGVWRSRAEFLVSAAIVVGWGSLTWGLVGFFPTAAAAIWRLSLGLLLLSLAGWKFVAFLARTGLYTLTRDAPRRGKNA